MAIRLACQMWVSRCRAPLLPCAVPAFPDPPAAPEAVFRLWSDFDRPAESPSRVPCRTTGTPGFSSAPISEYGPARACCSCTDADLWVTPGVPVPAGQGSPGGELEGPASIGAVSKSRGVLLERRGPQPDWGGLGGSWQEAGGPLQLACMACWRRPRRLLIRLFWGRASVLLPSCVHTFLHSLSDSQPKRIDIIKLLFNITLH